MSATTSSSLSAPSESVGGKLSAASKSIGSEWGQWLRLIASWTSNSASNISLIEQQSCHLLHHLMLILMEEILLVGQCLNVLAHLLGRVGGGGCCQLILIRQRCHLCCDRFGGVFIRIVVGKSTECILLEWKGWGISLMARSGGCRVESTLERLLNQPAEFYPHLCCFSQLVPIFEHADRGYINQWLGGGGSCW